MKKVEKLEFDLVAGRREKERDRKRFFCRFNSKGAS